MLAFLGDIHGDASVLPEAFAEMDRFKDVKALIQVGDFGWYKNHIQNFARIRFKYPTYFIGGNHEEYPLLTGYTEVTEVLPNCFYIPRGVMLELDGQTIAFCGGAASVDKKLRLKYGMAWHAEEVITEADIAKFDGVGKPDIMVTHTPPQSVIDNNFNPEALRQFGLDPKEWVDPSAHFVEDLWTRWEFPPLICGHMHKEVVDRTCRILNINEIMITSQGQKMYV